MTPSDSVFDNEGNAYPDLATFQLDSFVSNTKPVDYQLTQLDCERFFDLIYKFYGSFEYYDDIILWLNDINYISDEKQNFERKIKLYSKQDIDGWYIAGVKGEVVKLEDRIKI